MLRVPADPIGFTSRQIHFLWPIPFDIEEPRATRVELVDEFPRTVPQTEHAQRVVGEEECHARLAVEHRSALIQRRRPETDQIQDGRRGVDEAHHLTAADLARNQPWRGDEKWDMDV